MKKLRITLIALMLIGLLVPSTASADWPTPAYGTATVDGDYSEWDLENDFFANMYNAGNPNQGDPNYILFSKLYMRYDCANEMLYVLVLVEDDYDGLLDQDEAWIKIYDLGQSARPWSEFAWVGEDEDAGTVRGYEASTSLSPGDYGEIEVHIQIVPNETSSTGKGDDRISLLIECEEPEPGSLEVTKTVNWNGFPPDEDQTFEICISGPSHPDGDCQEADYDGGTLTWDDLEPGEYTVTETDPGAEWTVTIDPSSVTVTSGSTAQANVTNTYEVELGSLEVTKTVNWNKFPVDTSQTFEICITGPSYPDGDCQTVGANGGTLTWDDLEPGEYTVTETDPGMGWEVEITGSPVTVVKDETAQAEVTNTHEKCTAVDLISFTAQAGADGVTLAWETATEIDNAGFNLYRAMLEDGPYTKVNEALIPAQGDAASGASYSFLDTPDYGTYYYQLEDVDYNGVSTMHGPVKATMARPLRRPLYRPALPEF